MTWQAKATYAQAVKESTRDMLWMLAMAAAIAVGGVYYDNGASPVLYGVAALVVVIALWQIPADRKRA